MKSNRNKIYRIVGIFIMDDQKWQKRLFNFRRFGRNFKNLEIKKNIDTSIFQKTMF